MSSVMLNVGLKLYSEYPVLTLDKKQHSTLPILDSTITFHVVFGYKFSWLQLFRMDNAGLKWYGEILSNHIICTMVGYENILETVHVIKSIHRFLFLIFAYLVFLRFCCLKTDLMMCKLKDILYSSKIYYIMYIYLILDVKG